MCVEADEGCRVAGKESSQEQCVCERVCDADVEPQRTCAHTHTAHGTRPQCPSAQLRGAVIDGLCQKRDRTGEARPRLDSEILRVSSALFVRDTQMLYVSFDSWVVRAYTPRHSVVMPRLSSCCWKSSQGLCKRETMSVVRVFMSEVISIGLPCAPIIDSEMHVADTG